MMSNVEIVIDGTDCGGKTPLVETLTTLLRSKELRAASYAPFKTVEVYPLWKKSSTLAANTILSIMNEFRRQSPQEDVIIWDRGWPTVFINTSDVGARSLFQRFPDITVLLLNHVNTTMKKVRKHGLQAPWLTDLDSLERDDRAYHELAARLDAPNLVFKADDDGRYDLDLLAGIIHNRLTEKHPSLFRNAEDSKHVS